MFLVSHAIAWVELGVRILAATVKDILSMLEFSA